MHSNVRVVKAEYVTGLYPAGLPATEANGKSVGKTIICDDRDLRLPSQWVPGDARRNADGRNITYLVDLSDATPTGGLGSAQVEAAIDRAMASWNAIDCSTIPIVKRVDTGADPDVIDGLLGYGAVGTPHLGDIVHGGWMPPDFFELFFPGGGTSILGITFTSILLDPASENDINGDHQFDVGFREIYYNNHFSWGINADPPVADVETVSLHEAGHGLSQGHFGTIFVQNERIQFSPFAVMNAVIFGKNHLLQGTDSGGHCTTWGSWPTR
jgi:hypothetical protein